MKIICATDFSPAATAALQMAEALAAPLGDTLLLVHAVEDPLTIGDELVSPAERWQEVVAARAEQRLTGLTQALRERGVGADHLVLSDRPVDAILAVVSKEQPRLIVMGSHGRKGVGHLLLGSVAEQVAAQAACPTLVTRGLPYPEAGIAGEKRLHLMVFVCGRPAADAALAWVKTFRATVPCDVTFVEPYTPALNLQRFGLAPTGTSPAGPPALLPLLERDLRAWVGSLPGTGEVRFRFRSSDGHFSDDVATEAELLQPDFVVVGTRSGHFESGTALTTSQALRSLKLPTLCVPVRTRPAADRRIRHIRSVIVGTDLSDFANQAVSAAYSLLAGQGGVLEICYVHELSKDGFSFSGLPPLVPLDAKERSAIERKLGELALPEAETAGIETRVAVVEAEAAPVGLRQEAERLGADVIVVAAHGRTGFRRAVMGSVAAELVRVSHRPVLVLHPPAV